MLYSHVRLTLLVLLLAACAPQQQSSVPSNDRIPDSMRKILVDSCQKKGGLSPEKQAAFCSCVGSELQRTMSADDLYSIGLATRASGPDEAKMGDVVMQDQRVRHATTACLNAAYGG
jgi:hypothetical protein